LESLAICC